MLVDTVALRSGPARGTQNVYRTTNRHFDTRTMEFIIDPIYVAWVSVWV